jgi:aryl-alcohol dehydrogenase-like predicted oxidoreductase
VVNNQPRPQLAQLKYNVSRRTKPEDRRWLELFEQTGIGLQASDIFESGYLAGKTEVTRGVARDPGDIRPLIQEASPRFTALARDLGATPAQLSIAFGLSHPAIANVLFGCTSQAQLEENLAASALARRHGSEIRKLVEDFWFDRDRIDPESSWSAAPMELSPPVAAR